MKDPERLKEILNEIVADPRFQSRDITGDGNPETFCNMATNEALIRYVGYDCLHGKMANEMVGEMGESLDWEEVGSQEAATLAEAGEVVIAGQQKQGHGHVAVVYPHNIEHLPSSGKWKKKVPVLANVGPKDKTKITGANWCFSEEPKYFVFMGRELEEVCKDDEMVS